MGYSSEESCSKMVLKVKSLNCSQCYKKIDTILSKFPEIRNRAYDEQSKMVTITANCQNPQWFCDRLLRKGKGFIKHTEIKEPQKRKTGDEKKRPSNDNNVNCHCCQPHYFYTSNCYHPQVHYPLCHNVVPPLMWPPCHCCYHEAPIYSNRSSSDVGKNYYYPDFGNCVSDENANACTVM